MPRRPAATMTSKPAASPLTDDPSSAPRIAPVPKADPPHSPVVPRRQSSPQPATAPESTYDWLYEEARRRGLRGRSAMSKTELARALGY